ncbi:UPF0193 protein EVG1 isoform X2 [Parasteatoda tepidariorum]|uniref:UPF0193 protein EVG1 isoform X2 n=1 Tax=Parasteatoda tepidariorum TaxID=114398 RepID=UPI001C71A46F|nr:UPF0193 protein EVG1-like isoform X3 [Parasteatoda tepidariorum]
MEKPRCVKRNFTYPTSKKVGSNTSNILISLMKEVNLNQRLQNEVLSCVNASKPIPFVPKDLIKSKNIVKTEVKSSPLKLPPKPIQRCRKQIVESGSYNVEKYRPNPSKTRPPQEKERFQNIMAFGEDIDKEMKPALKDNIDDTRDSTDLFDEILLEIKERKEFIEDMRELGLAKKYLPEIQCQISVRLKELEKLDELRAQKIASEL